MLGVDDFMDIITSAICDPDNPDIRHELVPLFDCRPVGDSYSPATGAGEGPAIEQVFEIPNYGKYRITVREVV